MSNSSFRLAVLISGGGRTLLNLHDQILRGALPCTIQTVVATRPDIAGVERATNRGLPVTIIDPRNYRQKDGQICDPFHDDVHSAVKRADLVCMAGFLSLWRIPAEFEGRVINIHPALLPEFGGKGMYGRRVHEAVIASGKKISGCTVHICDNVYDHGPIVLQAEVPVLPSDTPETLAKRVFDQECIAFPEAVALFARNRIQVTGGSVHIIDGGATT